MSGSSVRDLVIAVALLTGAPIVSFGADKNVTYSKDVAPIVYKQCASCHRPGEVAPFSLLTYQDAAKRADQLAEATASKIMPPWKAEPRHGEFRDARILTEAEKAVFAEWAKAGAPKGDDGDLPPAPRFAQGWALGEPDLVVKMKEAVNVPAEGRDQIRIIRLPIELPSDKMLAAVDFRPGNRSVVHHALVVVDNIGLMKERTSTDDGDRSAGPLASQADLRSLTALFQSRTKGSPFALLGAWVPGSTPSFLRDGYGIPIAKESKIVLQMHYHPIGKAESDQSEVAFYFRQESGVKSIHPFTMAGLPLSIPAGENRFRVASSITLPVPITIHSIAPHMHQLGREMKVDAHLPDGGVTGLISIKDWDWNWQGRYTYQEPVTLPKGTRIDLEAFYDNSAENPANPNSPPKRVHWGEQTTDEMCLCFFQFAAESDADAATFRQNMFQQRLQQGLLRRARTGND